MALFKPNPDAESVEEIIEALARELADRYRDAENELIREVAARARRDLALQGMLPADPAGMGLTVEERRRQNRILAELAAHRAVAIRDLQLLAEQYASRLQAGGIADQVIRVAASAGEAAAAAMLGFAERPIGPVTLTGSASQAAALVAINLQSRLEILNQRITRYPQDAFQRIVALHSPSTLLGVTTSRVQQAATVQRFLAEGIPAFFDRSGRRWTIGAYAEMAGRTSVNRAYTDAGVWRMQQSGINLVTVVRGLDSCRRCAAWAGKILSTDGTTGVINLPHATIDGVTVPVHIAGTVEQARAAGWGHPNCRCRLVPYLPGLTIPQADTTYDEAAEKERAEQRRLEREIRAAKRREATAMNDTDRARARAQVRAAQADMRQFIRDTGRNRQSYREQLHFADGRGSAASRPSTPAPVPQALRSGYGIRTQNLRPVETARRARQEVPEGLDLEPHELASGERLGAVGLQVRWRPLDNAQGRKNPDATIGDDPALWDFKSPQGTGRSTISNQLGRAKKQGVSRVVIDMSRTPLDEQETFAELRRRLSGSDWLTDVIFIDRSGAVTWLTRE